MGDDILRTGSGRRARGFTLVEMMVVLALLSTLLLGAGQYFIASSRAYTSLGQRSHTSARTQVVLDRLVDELMMGQFISLTPPTPLASDVLRFEKVIDFVAGAPVFADPVQVRLVPTETGAGAGTDAIDNNGNGLVDEHTILIWEDAAPDSTNLPGPEDTASVIATNVASGGLLFTRSGGLLEIRLTLQAIAELGQPPIDHTLTTAVRMRN